MKKFLFALLFPAVCFGAGNVVIRQGAGGGNVVIQSGTSSGGGGSGGSSTVRVEDEGVFVVNTTTINFEGAGVTGTTSGGKAIITIPGSSGGGGGTTIWVKKDGAAFDNSVSTININTPGLVLTDGPAGQVNLSLDPSTTFYITASSGTTFYLQNSSAAVTYAYRSTTLDISSATSVYLQKSSATTTYVQRLSTQIFSGVTLSNSSFAPSQEFEFTEAQGDANATSCITWVDNYFFIANNRNQIGRMCYEVIGSNPGTGAHFGDLLFGLNSISSNLSTLLRIHSNQNIFPSNLYHVVTIGSSDTQNSNPTPVQLEFKTSVASATISYGFQSLIFSTRTVHQEGIQFGDGSVQTTAATGSGGGSSIYPSTSTPLYAGTTVRRGFFASAGAGVPQLTSGCVAATPFEYGTTNTNYVANVFTAGTTQYWQSEFMLPKTYVAGSTVSVTIVWTSTASTSITTWNIDAKATRNAIGLDNAWGTAVQIVSTSTVTNGDIVTSQSPSITIAGSPQAFDMVHLRVYRGDTKGDARFRGIYLPYPVNSASAESSQ